ncbi:hypothetical protein CDQ84_01485 [Clostridium thermosuccinogenes]|uniref:Uncharacterized protein n=1 Tax=Clostridium thermosuccinogenes TaxID=84032 RepID=A0A2K2FRF5_9CLOT|nr:HD-GYP domain-containing protein [Pseudoclostridium thermosuccinogenes]AUS95718.1 hypothetical protein CDO33_04245 [Pseudoclostridium thermosuccinogenes]PNT93558.1 hypothetical protein CDQ83_08685 [Pseudoclostridium thermosuccinogenes]PNT99920.1 hypothetical protein CDQ85_01485 [Pseudoclostridium thermosuccinogenes]PNU01365.1 hypothetical protein CDQ84_01485 [Pseudoclostridium thermosuccinogenes]
MDIPKKAIVYIIAILLIAVPVTYYLATTWSIDSWQALVFWAALAVVSESLGITLPNGMGISVGFAITIASLIVGGPLMSAVVTASGLTFMIIHRQGNEYAHIFNTPIYKTLFNAALGILSAGISGMVYTAVGGEIAKFSVIPVIISLITYIFLNSTIIVGLMSLLNHQSFINMWTGSIKGTLPSSLAVGTIGIIIALACISYGHVAVLLFFGPLLLARYSFKQYVNMRDIYMETIHALNKTMEAKDSYTSGHAARVEEYAVKLAKALKIPHQKVENIKTAAILHDIGKIGIDDSILRKPLPLTQAEYEEIQRHPVIGAEIIKDVAFLKDVADIIRHHHERYDGKGYPDGLKGSEISYEASILAIADVFDAMTSKRPYREPLSKEAALEEIRLNAGTQFNPELACKFIEIMK